MICCQNKKNNMYLSILDGDCVEHMLAMPRLLGRNTHTSLYNKNVTKIKWFHIEKEKYWIGNTGLLMSGCGCRGGWVCLLWASVSMHVKNVCHFYKQTLVLSSCYHVTILNKTNMNTATYCADVDADADVCNTRVCVAYAFYRIKWNLFIFSFYQEFLHVNRTYAKRSMERVRARERGRSEMSTRGSKLCCWLYVGVTLNWERKSLFTRIIIIVYSMAHVIYSFHSHSPQNPNLRSVLPKKTPKS